MIRLSHRLGTTVAATAFLYAVPALASSLPLESLSDASPLELDLPASNLAPPPTIIIAPVSGIEREDDEALATLSIEQVALTGEQTALNLPALDWRLAPTAEAMSPATRIQASWPDAVAIQLAQNEPQEPLAGGATNLAPYRQIPPDWADHVPHERARKRGFWQLAGTVKTETLLFAGYFTLISAHKFFKDTEPFHFKNEGWFGKDTDNIGVDKLAHTFNTYVLAEFLHSRIHRRSEASEGDALTAGAIAFGLVALNEVSDAFEPDSGYSLQDITMNLAGAGFSVLRNTVPGLKEKLSYKISIVPNDSFYSFSGKPHYAQMRFMFSLKGSGFEKLRETPLRYLDLQVGYYASDFLIEDRERGIEPKRHLFVGVGLNLGELLFGKSRSPVGRGAYTFLDYFQVPYTSVRVDQHGEFDF